MSRTDVYDIEYCRSISDARIASHLSAAAVCAHCGQGFDDETRVIIRKFKTRRMPAPSFIYRHLTCTKAEGR